jgi:hypothetical protein
MREGASEACSLQVGGPSWRELISDEPRTLIIDPLVVLISWVRRNKSNGFLEPIVRRHGEERRVTCRPPRSQDTVPFLLSCLASPQNGYIPGRITGRELLYRQLMKRDLLGCGDVLCKCVRTAVRVGSDGGEKKEKLAI